MSENTSQDIITESVLVPVYTNENEEPVVNARELHQYLEVGRDFSHWIKDKISKYGFIEGEDFSSFLAESSGGRPNAEYIITLDTAKEIAMVQNNEKGRMARKYFIAVEKKYRAQQLQELEKIKQMDKQIHTAQCAAGIAQALVKEYTSYGIPKNEVAIIVHDAKLNNTSADITIHQYLEGRRQKEIKTKRNRIYVRIQTLGSIYKEIYPELNEDPWEHSWHRLASELRYDLGHTVSWQTRHDRDKTNTEQYNRSRHKGVTARKCPSYLDYIEEDGCFKEAELAINRLIRKAKKIQEKREAQRDPLVDDLRGLIDQ